MILYFAPFDRACNRASNVSKSFSKFKSVKTSKSRLSKIRDNPGHQSINGICRNMIPLPPQ